jgi:N-acetylglucosaminyl-diphospho-decaprenol L-rhamnosyltransferase
MTGVADSAGGNPDPWQRVTAVAVAYRSAAVIGPCLRSVARAKAAIVVDNASDDGSAQAARVALPTVVVLSNPVNQGFGRANNQAAALVGTEFMLFINPDAELEHGAVESLIAAADRYPDAGLLAPGILTATGDRIATHNVGLFDQNRMVGTERILPEGDICTDFLSGALMLVRTTAFRAIGGFDPNIFLYYEDDDLCLRLRRAGYSLVQTPSAAARHMGGQSSPPTADVVGRKFWHMAWSRLYLEAKHRGKHAARASAIRNAAAYWVKIVAHALARHRDKTLRDRARLAGTVAYLRGRTALAKAGVTQ